jgi:hypothetical protein
MNKKTETWLAFYLREAAMGTLPAGVKNLAEFAQFLLSGGSAEEQKSIQECASELAEDALSSFSCMNCGSTGLIYDGGDSMLNCPRCKGFGSISGKYRVTVMRYRAVAVGLEKDGHPVQITGMVIGPVVSWAHEMAKMKGVPVDIFESEERLIMRREPPEVEA